jgi:hypothetical protein
MLKARPKLAQPLTAVLKPTDLAPGLSREAGSCMGAEPTDCVWPKLAESSLSDSGLSGGDSGHSRVHKLRARNNRLNAMLFGWGRPERARAVTALTPLSIASGTAQLVQKPPCRGWIGSVEAFGELVIDRLQHRRRVGGPALITE